MFRIKNKGPFGTSCVPGALFSTLILTTLPLLSEQAPSASAPVAGNLVPAQSVPAQTVSPSLPGQARVPGAEEIADTLVAHRRYQEAIQDYQKVPPTAAVWNKMGIAYQMMFNLREATRCYKESLKLNPHNANVLNNLGTVYDATKDYKQAEHYYHKSLKYDPHSAVILKNLGTNLLTQHKYARGWEAYKEALATDPDIFENRNGPQVQNPASIEQRGAMNYYMAMGCARAGQTACALEYLRKALDEGFTNPKKVASDVAFARLRDNPDFKQMLASLNSSKAQQLR
jgi:tetratricopeptide (TPR) repeat protein